MTAVTQHATSRVPVDTLGIDSVIYGSGAGAGATIDWVIAQLQKIGNDMRDLERQFAEVMQRVTFDRQLLSLESKRGAIELNRQSATASGIAQIVGGAVGMMGAATNTKIGMAAADGFSTAGRGIAGVHSGSVSFDAQNMQLKGEFEGQSAEYFQKTLAATLERALDASRQMREATRELVSLRERIASAVRL
jgi:secreted effector protein SseD